MASVTLILKDRKAEGKTQIVLCLSFNGQRIKVATGESVEPVYWNNKKYEVIQTLQVPNFQEINNNLTIIKNRAKEIHENLVQECALSGRRIKPEDIKPDLRKYLFSAELLNRSQEKLSFFEYFERLIKVRLENKKVGDKSIFIYRRAYSLLWNFQYDTNERVAFERFNLEFSVKFRKYLEEKMGFSPNTIQKHFKIIRMVLNTSETEGYIVNRQYKSDDFMPSGEEVFDIALSLREVETLYAHDFSHNRRLEKVRDLFIIGCYTGLRFSDFKRLGKEHLQGGYLKIVQEKTKKKNPLPVVIPILKPVQEIFEKYDYKLPNDISNQKMNEYLKEMAKETKLFDELVTYRRTKGGKSELVSNPKYQEITTHTARRTYCTMSYNLGIPTQTIMMISGHKTETAFLRYLKVTNEEHAERTLKIWEAYYTNVENQVGKTVKLQPKIS